MYICVFLYTSVHISLYLYITHFVSIHCQGESYGCPIEQLLDFVCTQHRMSTRYVPEAYSMHSMYSTYIMYVCTTIRCTWNLKLYFNLIPNT